MIVTKHSVKTKARKEGVWQFYANLAMWPDWDEDIVFARIHEPNNFVHGAKGVIKIAGGSKVKFELS